MVLWINHQLVIYTSLPCCSAGVGRTGAFITMYTQMERIKGQDTVDVTNFVHYLRKQRCLMVQTEVGGRLLSISSVMPTDNMH